MGPFKRCAGMAMVLLLSGEICSAETKEELQWPWWHGPFSNQSAVPANGPQLPRPRLRWYGTEFAKLVHGHRGSFGLVGGAQSLVLHDDRVYASFYVGSDHRVCMDVAFDEVDDAPGKGKPTTREQYRRLLSEDGDKVGLYGKHLYSARLSRVGFDAGDLDRVLRMAFNVHADDVVVCFDALTGQALWRSAVPGGYHLTRGSYGPHLTPSVDPTTGRLYAVGTTGRVLCFDGATGELLWINEERGTVAKWEAYRVKGFEKRKCGGCNRGRYEAAFAVDGVVVVGGRALDGATGETLWQLSGTHWNWLPWSHEGTWYLINRGTRLIEPRTGRVLWQEKQGTSTGREGLAIALQGDLMVCENACYRISPSGRKLLWRNEQVYNQSATGLVIQQGRVYQAAYQPDLVADLQAKGVEGFREIKRAYGKKRPRSMLGLDLATGEVVQNWTFHGNFTSSGSLLVGLDGRLVWGDLHLLDLTDTDPDVDEARGDRFRCTDIAGIDGGMHPYAVQTPAAYRGRMYYRGGHSVFCLDYNAQPEPMPEPRAADPAVARVDGLLAGLGAAGKAERQAALERLLASPPQGSGDSLVALLRDGRHQTAAAAAAVLQALDAEQDLGERLATSIAAAADTWTATRLGLGLAAWYRHAPAACAAWVATRLASADQAVLRQVGDALNQPLVSRSAALIAEETVIDALSTALPQAEGMALAALGRAIGWLDRHPQALARLAPTLAAVAEGDAPPAITSALAIHRLGGASAR